MQTGDLVLIESITPCACCVSLWSQSKINHVGLILKDINLDDMVLNGTYVLESGLEIVENNENNEKNENNKIRILPFGTQIQPIETIQNQSVNIYYRHIKTERNDDFINKIKNIYEIIKSAPYDLRISVWSELFDVVVLNKNIKNITSINEAEKQKTFTCSAMVAYILTKLGYSILETVNGNWNMITPKFFNDLNEPWLEPRKNI